MIKVANQSNNIARSANLVSLFSLVIGGLALLITLYQVNENREIHLDSIESSFKLMAEEKRLEKYFEVLQIYKRMSIAYGNVVFLCSSELLKYDAVKPFKEDFFQGMSLLTNAKFVDYRAVEIFKAFNGSGFTILNKESSMQLLRRQVLLTFYFAIKDFDAEKWIENRIEEKREAIQLTYNSFLENTSYKVDSDAARKAFLNKVKELNYQYRMITEATVYYSDRIKKYIEMIDENQKYVLKTFGDVAYINPILGKLEDIMHSEISKNVVSDKDQELGEIVFGFENNTPHNDSIFNSMNDQILVESIRKYQLRWALSEAISRVLRKYKISQLENLGSTKFLKNILLPTFKDVLQKANDNYNTTSEVKLCQIANRKANAFLLLMLTENKIINAMEEMEPERFNLTQSDLQKLKESYKSIIEKITN